MKSELKAIVGCIALFLVLLSSQVLSAGPDGYCLIGQEWPGFKPAWVQPATITGGGETFYVLIDPGVRCDCPIGFEATTMDFFMTFPEETSLPVTITVSMGLSRAVADPSGQLPWLPGQLIGETPMRDFTFSIPKDYVGFGIALDSECAGMDESYFLSFTIHSAMDPPGGFCTDGSGTPEEGRSLTQIDGQWVDMVAEGILTRGDLVVSGFAQCCEDPVSTSIRNWSSIKSLFHD